jgi:hypothetical protein
MRDTVEMASDGMKHVSRFMKIDSGIQVILRLLRRQFESCSVGTTNNRFLNMPLILPWVA